MIYLAILTFIFLCELKSNILIVFSTKMEVVEEKETNTKSNKIQIWKEDSQVEGDSVFVGNIDLKAKRKDLLKFFKPYGEVRLLAHFTYHFIHEIIVSEREN